MSIKQTTENKKSASKKSLLLEVSLQISKSTSELREKLGDKKFEKRIKKAAKILIEGIKETKETTPVKAVKTKTIIASKVPAPSKKAATPKKKVIKAVGVKKENS
jgi:hypothetical protein